MVKIYVRNFGVMTVKMDYDAAKNTASNFVELARNGFYDGLIFHRIIKGFMIQGGGYNEKGQEKDTGYVIHGDFASNGTPNPLKHTRGVISMARTMIKDSASSQFFIMHKDAPHLDGEYAAFGELVDGFDVLDAIAKVRVDHYMNKPYDNVVIDKVEVIDEPINEVKKIKE